MTFLNSRIYSILSLLLLCGVDTAVARDGDAELAYQQEQIDEHRANRGLVQLDNNFVPQGQFIAGATLSYSTHLNDEYSFAIIEGINSDGYSFNVSPIVAYALKDNLALGGRIEYSRSMLEIDSALMSVGGDSSIDLQLVDYYAIQQNYTIMAITRHYIPLGASKRFALFSELRLEAGMTQSKFAFDQPVVGTFSKGYNLGIGVVPGVVAFATNSVAIEVTVGMMGIGYSHSNQVHNQVYVGESNSSSMNFKLSLLSIGLGFAFYL